MDVFTRPFASPTSRVQSSWNGAQKQRRALGATFPGCFDRGQRAKAVGWRRVPTIVLVPLDARCLVSGVGSGVGWVCNSMRDAADWCAELVRNRQ
jgi:hypothetical protein